MKITKTSLTSTWKEFYSFIQSTDFSKAVMLGIALTVPILVGLKLDALQIGITVTLGAMLASPSDVSGSINHKVKGILLATFLVMVVSFIGAHLHLSLWFLFPVLGLLMFSISYLSIYGFRASLISFSGLFALVLSFSKVSSAGLDIYDRILFIGVGGLWYALLTLTRHYIFPKAPTEFYLSKTFNLTADYLDVRRKLVSEKSDRKELMRKLLNLQVDLTTTHETLRDILISRRSGSGKSNYEGKRVLIFAQLVDMLEQAMANPVNYKKTDLIFNENTDQLQYFQDLLSAMSEHLREISENLSTPKRIGGNKKLKKIITLLEESINQSGHPEGLDTEENRVMLKNLLKYQKEQVTKIEKIQWLLENPAQREIASINRKDARRFLTRETYDIEVLVENFNMRSPIFRHSLRLAVVTIIGFGIGEIFSVQNPYWILLTLIVIMRPSFGLTKTRSRERTIGTLIGGFLAVIIVLLIQNTAVYAILAIISLVTAFSMIQRNYKAGATFTTLFVVFIYALLRPDIFNVIQFRVVDTLVGAGLATLGNLFLWPAWEVQAINKTLLRTIKAYRDYLNEITFFYKTKGPVRTGYKVARKQAFLAMSDLSAAFQRMTQEPKSRQNNMDVIYEVVVLNNTFLASLASFSTYILNHPTTPASSKFEKVTARIDENLREGEEVLQKGLGEDASTDTNEENLVETLFGKDLNHQKDTIGMSTNEDYHILIEEAHLVREQLKWLLAMSEKMPKLLRKIGTE